MPVHLLNMATSVATGTAVDASAWKPVLDAMTAQISVTSIVGVLATLVVAGVGLVFMWWGVRKAAGSLMAAFKRGRLKL